MVVGRQEEEALPWVTCVTEPAPAASSKGLETLGPWDFPEPHHLLVERLDFPRHLLDIKPILSLPQTVLFSPNALDTKQYFPNWVCDINILNYNTCSIKSTPFLLFNELKLSNC